MNATPRPWRAANAALIVRAVNCHDALVEALEALATDAELLTRHHGGNWAAIHQARAILARAKGDA